MQCHTQMESHYVYIKMSDVPCLKQAQQVLLRLRRLPYAQCGRGRAQARRLGHVRRHRTPAEIESAERVARRLCGGRGGARAAEDGDEVVERVARRAREQVLRGGLRRRREDRRRGEPGRRGRGAGRVVEVEQVLRLLARRDGLERLLCGEVVVAEPSGTRTVSAGACGAG